MKSNYKIINVPGTFEIPVVISSLINEYDANEKIIHIDCYREKNLKRWIR